MIAGVAVRTNNETQYRNEADEIMTQSDFFSIALVGIKVEVEGDETGVSEISATELSL